MRKSRVASVGMTEKTTAGTKAKAKAKAKADSSPAKRQQVRNDTSLHFADAANTAFQRSGAIGRQGRS
jgi:hypothetical protein